METYTMLRSFADSWALAVLTLVFLAAIVWIFRPGARALQSDAAASIFRNEFKPAGDDGRGENRDPTRGQKEA